MATSVVQASAMFILRWSFADLQWARAKALEKHENISSKFILFARPGYEDAFLFMWLCVHTQFTEDGNIFVTSSVGQEHHLRKKQIP